MIMAIYILYLYHIHISYIEEAHMYYRTILFIFLVYHKLQWDVANTLIKI